MRFPPIVGGIVFAPVRETSPIGITVVLHPGFSERRTGPEAVQETQKRTDVPATSWVRRREQVSPVTEPGSPLPDAKLLVQAVATSPAALISAPGTMATLLPGTVSGGRRANPAQLLCPFGSVRAGIDSLHICRCNAGTADYCPSGHSTFSRVGGVAA